jgi:DNA-binding beta-propeller fold protein YncE
MEPLPASAGTTVAELDTSFETVEEGVQSDGATGADGVPAKRPGDAAADAGSALSPQQETATPEDLGNEAEKTGDTGTDAIIENQQFEDQGQPTGLEPVKLLAIFSTDISGKRMGYPSNIYYDWFMNEIYVSSSGPLLTIYNDEYFPVASLGEGRGIINMNSFVVDKEGHIFVSQGQTSDDQGRTRPSAVRVFNAAFFKVRDMYMDEIPGTTNFQPDNMALSPGHDLLYIASRGGQGVLVLDLEGNFKRWLVPLKVGGVIEEIGDDPGHPDALRIKDVVVDSNGRIYMLAHFDGRIYVLDRNENFLFAFGILGGSTGKLSNPRSIAVDVKRQVIYVVDYMRHAVNVYDYVDGEFLFEFGGLGRSEGWFQFPNHIAVDRYGHVLVADMFNNRVQVFHVP